MGHSHVCIASKNVINNLYSFISILVEENYQNSNKKIGVNELKKRASNSTNFEKYEIGLSQT